MSTVNKLDPHVRVIRSWRKFTLNHIRHEVNNTKAPLEARATAALVLSAITKICRDPRRTGITKHRILHKLGVF